MRQNVSIEALERVLGRMTCCAAMLSVLADSERTADSTALSALLGVNDLLGLARDDLDAIIDTALAVPAEGGVQYAP